jgi:hypothetical protein
MAAFALEPMGEPAPCGFPRCVLDAYHEGDHHLAPIERPSIQPVFVCRECKKKFVIYGKSVGVERLTCGSEECILSSCRREANKIPVACRCRQRSYAHDLSVHRAIKFESGPMRWPWTLRYAPDMELRA